jgi:hypothetical protein
VGTFFCFIKNNGLCFSGLLKNFANKFSIKLFTLALPQVKRLCKNFAGNSGKILP